MEVIVSNNVKTALEEYRKSLKNYPISLERAHKKFANMISALQALGTAISTPSVCMNKDLLQSFDSNGNPMNKNLKRFNYKDERGFQWAFACLYDYDNDTITILKMMAAPLVKECISELVCPILEFHNRLRAIR